MSTIRHQASVAASCVKGWMDGKQCMLAHVNLAVNVKLRRCGINQNQSTCNMYGDTMNTNHTYPRVIKHGNGKWTIEIGDFPS